MSTSKDSGETCGSEITSNNSGEEPKNDKKKEYVLNEKKKERVLNSLRKERTKISKQQILCIALMNKFCKIKMGKPFKISKVSDQYMRVKAIEIHGSLIDIDMFLKRRCEEKYKDDLKKGVEEKTASRRKQINKKIDEINLYQDILLLHGYYFDCTECWGKNLPKLQVIEKVFYNGKLLFNKRIIDSVCDEARNFILSLMEKTTEKSFEVEINDPYITDILIRFKLTNE